MMEEIREMQCRRLDPLTLKMDKEDYALRLRVAAGAGKGKKNQIPPRTQRNATLLTL
jgi:hypothetical protein